MTILGALQTTLKLLSDPTRLRLLCLLAQEELAVQELVSITGLAQSRVSNHLSILKRSGLVRDRREGSWSFHSLVPPGPTAPLSPELYEAVIAPYQNSEDGRADTSALETVREQRRERSRAAHDALADRWVELGQEFTSGSLRSEVFGALAPRDFVVADLGCGAGFLTSFLAGRARRVIAVDHSNNMIEAARRREMGGVVEFRQGELEQLPLADGEVDAAFANLVWHHLADMERGAAEVFRILRPGGTVVVSDLMPHEEEWMRETMADLRLGLRPDVVTAVLARAGFVNLTTEPSHDSYRVESPSGRTANLPMFLVRGQRPGAEALEQTPIEPKPENTTEETRDDRS